MEVKENPRRCEKHVQVKATEEMKEINAVLKRKRQEETVLSDEIILHEILPWLPVKPLFRFKLVCKDWDRVISTDSFFKTSQSQKCVCLPPSGLVYYGRKNYVVLPTAVDQELVVGLPPDTWLKYGDMCEKYHKVFNHDCSRSLVACSNGLVCGTYYKGKSECFFVSNPITKELVSIPNSNKLSDITLAFEPSSSNPYYSMVSRNVINVALDQNSNGNDITDVGFTVYSSKQGIWKTANAKVQIFRRSFGKFFTRTLSRSIFTTGKLYWKLEKDLLWFHIEQDSAGVVALPDDEETFSDGEIGDWNGELSYTKISAQNIEIWVLSANQKFEVKWVKKYCLSLMRIFEDNANIILPYFHTMIKLSKKLSAGSNHRRSLPYEGGSRVLFLVKKTEGKEEGIIFSYNMITGSLQLNSKSKLRRWEGPLLSYKNTLASLPQPCESIST